MSCNDDEAVSECRAAAVHDQEPMRHGAGLDGSDDAPSPAQPQSSVYETDRFLNKSGGTTAGHDLIGGACLESKSKAEQVVNAAYPRISSRTPSGTRDPGKRGPGISLTHPSLVSLSYHGSSRIPPHSLARPDRFGVARGYAKPCGEYLAIGETGFEPATAQSPSGASASHACRGWLIRGGAGASRYRTSRSGIPSGGCSRRGSGDRRRRSHVPP